MTQTPEVPTTDNIPVSQLPQVHKHEFNLKDTTLKYVKIYKTQARLVRYLDLEFKQQGSITKLKH